MNKPLKMYAVEKLEGMVKLYHIKASSKKQAEDLIRCGGGGEFVRDIEVDNQVLNVEVIP